MSGKTKRAFVGVLAVGLATLVTPAAHAASNTTHGGCFLVAGYLDNLTSGAEVGFLGDVSLTQDSPGAPTGATVTCWIDVNGVEAGGTRFSYTGFGAQAGVNEVRYDDQRSTV